MREKLSYNQRLALELIEWRTSLGVSYSVDELLLDLCFNSKNIVALCGALNKRRLIVLQEIGNTLTSYNILLTEQGKAELSKEWDNKPADLEAIKQATKELVQGRKLQVLNYYSDNLLCCGCCGERHIEFLGLEYIGGASGRNYLTKRGIGLYEWIVDNGYPAGFVVSCFNCRIVKKGKKAGFVCPHNRKSF